MVLRLWGQEITVICNLLGEPFARDRVLQELKVAYQTLILGIQNNTPKFEQDMDLICLIRGAKGCGQERCYLPNFGLVGSLGNMRV
jgi:hypothetical protein